MNSAWLNTCDVFYLAGGTEKDITAMFVDFQSQLQVLRDLIFSGSVCFIGGCGGAMAAGHKWSPRDKSPPDIRMLNLLNDVDVGVEEPDHAYASRKTNTPYIHLTPRIGALVCWGEARAFYLARSGQYKNESDTIDLQANLTMAMDSWKEQEPSWKEQEWSSWPESWPSYTIAIHPAPSAREYWQEDDWVGPDTRYPVRPAGGSTESWSGHEQEQIESPTEAWPSWHEQLQIIAAAKRAEVVIAKPPEEENMLSNKVRYAHNCPEALRLREAKRSAEASIDESWVTNQVVTQRVMAPRLWSPRLSDERTERHLVKREATKVPQCTHEKRNFGDLHAYDVWSPPPPRAGIKSAVVYLPTTCDETPSAIEMIMLHMQDHGPSMVLKPSIKETTNHPHRIPVLDWIQPWILSLQEQMPEVSFCLMGCSRGAAWGLELMESSLKFKTVVLMAPYYQGHHKGYGEGMENALKQRLRNDKHAITIVYGTTDIWPPPDSLIHLFRELGSADSVIELSGGHDVVIEAKDRFWPTATVRPWH